MRESFGAVAIADVDLLESLTPHIAIRHAARRIETRHAEGPTVATKHLLRRNMLHFGTRPELLNLAPYASGRHRAPR